MNCRSSSSSSSDTEPGCSCSIRLHGLLISSARQLHQTQQLTGMYITVHCSHCFMMIFPWRWLKLPCIGIYKILHENRKNRKRKVYAVEQVEVAAYVIDQNESSQEFTTYTEPRKSILDEWTIFNPSRRQISFAAYPSGGVPWCPFVKLHWRHSDVMHPLKTRTKPREEWMNLAPELAMGSVQREIDKLWCEICRLLTVSNCQLPKQYWAFHQATHE